MTESDRTITWKIIESCLDYEINNNIGIRNRKTLKIIPDYRNSENGSVKLSLNRGQKTSNRYYLYEKTWLSKEQWKYYKEIEELKIKYPKYANQFEDAYSLYPHYRDNLLIIRNPELIDEWCEENEISLGLVRFGSDEKRIWKCKKPDHKKYSMSPNARTEDRKKGCTECARERIDYKLTSMQGAISECWLANELVNKGIDSTRQNNNNKVADVVSIINEKQYAIQCKTLALRGTKYVISMGRHNYPDNLLIIAVNKEKNKFVYFFSKETNNITTVTVDNKKIIDNKENFLDDIIKLIPQSFIIENILDYLNESGKKEYIMKQRLKEYVKKLNLSYREHNCDHDSIDCFINNIPCQLKYSSRKQYKKYNVNLTKSRNNKKVSYSMEDEFEILIAHVADYENDFFIIGKKTLAALGYVEIDYKSAVTAISVSEPNDKSHRFFKYWNNNGILK